MQYRGRTERVCARLASRSENHHTPWIDGGPRASVIQPRQPRARRDERE